MTTRLATAATIAAELRHWPRRRWTVATLTALATVFVIAIPTDLIDTPLFRRDIPPTWWSWPVLIVNAILAGLGAATYVRVTDNAASRDTGGRLGTFGTVVTFFAVGCPVCNKLVLLALGYTGAIQFFEPIQPFLALGAIVLLGWAFVARVQRARSCPITPEEKDTDRGLEHTNISD